MAELTNLTDRLTHLRDRKGDPSMGADKKKQPQPPKKNHKTNPPKVISGRRFSNDYFLVFVYALLAVAMLTQFALIALLDIL